MGDRLTPELAQKIRRLLKRGLSRREVREKIGASRHAADEVALEIHPDARRCGGCGLLVYAWPCLQCQIRARRERGC